MCTKKDALRIFSHLHCSFNLSFDGVLKTPSFDREGGGVKSTPAPFLFVKTIEKVIRLCTVLIFFLSGSFEDMGIFQVQNCHS